MIPLMLGGEMPHWSDSSPAGGPVLASLSSMAQGHTLVIGPHDHPLIDAVETRRVTVLVRGVPDAEALATRYASRPGFEVCCGSLDKLAAVPAYDTVLALDGLDRAGSTESDGLTWADSLAVLLAVLRPGGRLLLGLDNPAGLHRLLALPPSPGDGDWAVAEDPTRPLNLEGLHDRLTAAGLDVLRSYAAFPAPGSPAALISPAALSEPALHGFLAGVLRRAGLPEEPVLADPRPVAVQMLQSGLAAQTAPGWFVLAVPGGAAGMALPHALMPGRQLEMSERGWTLSGPHQPVQPVPAGRNLLEALLAAARGQDLPGLRSLLTAWQGGETAGIDADEIVVDADGRLHGFGSAGEPLEALQRFAGAAPPELAELIAAMAGVADLRARPDVAAFRARPDVAAFRARPDVAAFREVVAERDRLALELNEAKQQTHWYEQRLGARDAELARAYRIISLLKGTVPGKAATAMRGALRTGKQAARTALRQLRKP